MKIERIRNNHKKKIVIISVVIVLALVSTITLTMSKSKYRLTESMKLVTGTINYKVPDMRVVAVNISEDGINYEIVDDIPESGYILNEERSICKVATETSGIENAPKDNNITIEYIEGKLNIKGVSKRNTRCYLYFDKYVPKGGEAILASINKDYIKSGNPDFTKVATGAETVADNGIYKTADPMYSGETYYWRGAATTNHVIFANKCWRIVRINGDGTIRLIYNGAIKSGNACTGNGSNSGSIAVTSQTYNLSRDNASYVGYTYTAGVQRPTPTTGGTASNLKTKTENWLNANIRGDNLQKIADGKYCNDRNTTAGYWFPTESVFYYLTYGRLISAKTPTLSCDTNDVYTLKAGAITADEVAMAGGVNNTNNSSYYLYNGQSYWTMSPAKVYSSSTCAAVFYVNANGYLSDGSDVNFTNGVRPVINLHSDVTFNSGSDGTQNNPYIVQ